MFTCKRHWLLDVQGILWTDAQANVFYLDSNGKPDFRVGPGRCFIAKCLLVISFLISS